MLYCNIIPIWKYLFYGCKIIIIIKFTEYEEADKNKEQNYADRKKSIKVNTCNKNS